jgi:hypothetical protein
MSSCPDPSDHSSCFFLGERLKGTASRHKAEETRMSTEEKGSLKRCRNIHQEDGDSYLQSKRVASGRVDNEETPIQYVLCALHHSLLDLHP